MKGLTIEQIIHYQTEGYLIAEDVLTDEDLQPVIEELEQEIDRRAQALHAEGKISDLHENESFERRFALLHAQCPEIGKRFDISDYLGDAIFRFLGNEHLLDVVECLLGSELSCNPIQHLRAKLPWKPGKDDKPDYFQNVPWHQDNAVTSADSEASEIITFWLPLVNATAETGCMEVMPEVSKMGYLKHRSEGGTTIVPEQLPHVQPILAECRKGSIVIMNKYTPHRGTTNTSDIVRWSLDLRYHKLGAQSGRSIHPSFAVRSTKQPELVLSDANEWRNLWQEARNRKAEGSLHRV